MQFPWRRLTLLETNEGSSAKIGAGLGRSPVWGHKTSRAAEGTMNISITCSKCGRSLKVPESAAGRKTKCPKCGAVLLVAANLSGEDRHSPGPPPIPPELEEEHASPRARLRKFGLIGE